jgi:hypothetical protein
MKMFAALTALLLLPSLAVAQEKTQEQLREEQAVIFQHDGSAKTRIQKDCRLWGQNEGWLLGQRQS